MSHFYASIEGNRGPATRQGSKDSGISAHARGWSFGVRAFVFHDTDTDTDRAHVYLTLGSNGQGSDKYLGTYSADDLKN